MKMKLRITVAALLLSASPLTSPARAQGFNLEPSEAPAQPAEIALAPKADKGAPAEQWNRLGQQPIVRNVVQPTIAPFLPAKDKATGAAVVILPGGGFQFLSIENEGWAVARWLAERGVAAFVVKYRTAATPRDTAEFTRAMIALFTATRPADITTALNPATEIAKSDAQAALRLVRDNAAKWDIDPRRVGMLGFSAGAITTLAVTLADAPDARPDFIAPIYGPMDSVAPPASPQPMFTALAADDGLFAGRGFGVVEAWQAKGGSVELHYYEGGGHGFGAQESAHSSARWLDHFHGWMAARGLLKPAP